ncbi:ABC transporter substrate-binding protein [Cereibacter sphaeroides]|uniref:ABC transporter substrate-binding protein n=1 Tax=Cereibacter sphaeroides TaxID=1063 RepID=UPI000F52A5D0|nr:ABC transporter substrate-binding protein [Cereibacter sphaeroides]AZB65396.1 ABC transporter substrate-binding protein [Cereibacter sphaeroides]AZB70092.1 ABC transporter substrate-binding protein [Cereibacter sphaeroides]
MITRRHLMASIGASALMLPLARRAMAQQPFVIPTYGGTWAKLWEETLVPEFTSATGIQSQIDVGLGKDFVSKIRAGGGASPYSVFMGNENIAATLRAEGFFEPLDMSKIPNAADMYDGLINPGNNGLRAIVSPIGLAWRTDMIQTPPKAWTDLWENPEYAGQIGLYQIGNTGAQLFLRLAGRLFGSGDTDIDTAFTKIKELQPFTQASWSGEVAAQLMRGDVAIAPVDWTEILTLQDKGAPVEIIVPEEGVLSYEQSFNIVKTGPDKEAAHAYINFLLDPKMQSILADTFYVSPANREAVISEATSPRLPVQGEAMSKIIRFEWDNYIDIAAEVADRWNREIG